MTPTSQILNKFHDKKRKLDYVRITRMLRGEGPMDPQTVRERDEAPGQIAEYQIGERLLEPLEESLRRMDLMSPPPENRRSEGTRVLHNIVSPSNGQRYHHNAPSNRIESVRDLSVSNTIHELHQKLGEIIHSRQMDTNYMESEEKESFDNLNNFLK